MIKLSNVNIGYNKKTILNDVNLSLEKGKLYGILGPNGAGKSTLLKAISRDISLQKGSIYINGICHKEYDDIEFAKKVSYMRQRIKNTFPFKVKEIVTMGRYCHHYGNPNSNDEKVINYYLDLNNLIDFKNKSITELSGGELQRVLFSKTLSQDSDCILIDEGMSNADLHYKIKFMENLKKEVKKDKLIICVLHDLNLARRFCDELIILNDNEVKHNGISKEVLNREVLKSVFKVDGFFEKNSLIIS